jgi:hypothetical protein
LRAHADQLSRLPLNVANADAAASPHTDAAFLEAHRAISDVLYGARSPSLHVIVIGFDVARS